MKTSVKLYERLLIKHKFFFMGISSRSMPWILSLYNYERISYNNCKCIVSKTKIYILKLSKQWANASSKCYRAHIIIHLSRVPVPAFNKSYLLKTLSQERV